MGHRQQTLDSYLCAAFGLLLCCASAVWAQTTAFTYQGKLTDAGNPANGNYELQFKLFDTPTVGTGAQQGGTLLRDPVAASAGVFTVTLDFGANVFSGANRYLEIGVRPDGSASAYTVLAPRQPVTASPYAIQTLNSQQLGSLPASRYLASAANGNFGINTANPISGRLHVEGGSANAVFAHSNNSIGLYGTSTLFEGVRGEAFDIEHGAMVGIHNGGGIGVFGSSSGAGVQGTSAGGRGVIGTSTTGTGIYGITTGVGITTPGVYGVATSVGGIGVIGEANNTTSIGVFGVSANASGYGIYARNLFGGRALYAEGHVGQALYSGGIVKAMVEVQGNAPLASIVRCYNGNTGSSTGNCGFTLSQFLAGVYQIDFGFQVSNRFVAVTAKYDSATVVPNNVGANYRFFSSSVCEVFTFSAGDSSNTTSADFMLIVF